MQKIKYLSIILVNLLLVCCGGDGDGDNKGDILPDPQTYSQTVNVASEQSTQTVTLTSLKFAISNITQSSDWCKAAKMSYSSGPPSIQLKVAENETGKERRANFVITDTYGNSVILTVVQVQASDTPAPNPEPTPEPQPNEGGIDYSHNVVSDQPAFAKKH